MSNDSHNQANKIHALLYSPVISALLGGTIIAAGWFVAFDLNQRSALENDRRQLRTEYLLKAYRDIAGAANRKSEKEKWHPLLEQAISDVQLLGSEKQIELAVKFANEMKDGSAKVDPILQEMRKSLRKELHLEPVKKVNKNIINIRMSK